MVRAARTVVLLVVVVGWCCAQNNIDDDVFVGPPGFRDGVGSAPHIPFIADVISLQNQVIRDSRALALAPAVATRHQLDLPQCYLRFPSYVIVNVAPFHRRNMVSLGQCQAECQYLYIMYSNMVDFRCLSFVYNYASYSCDFYSTRPRYDPKHMFGMPGFDYFEVRTNCDKPLPTILDLVKSPIQARISRAEDKKAPMKVLGEMERVLMLRSTAPSTTATTRLPSTTTIDPQIMKRDSKNGLSGQSYLRVRIFHRAATASIASANCPIGTTALFTTVDGQFLESSNFLRLHDIEEEKCASLCLSNKDHTGSMFYCASFNYDISESTCTLMQEQAHPNGPERRTELVERSYTEKICLKDDAAQFCPRGARIEQIPGMTVTSGNQAAIHVDDLQECIQNCLTSLKQFGFRCRSGTYYQNESQHSLDNCILSTENHRSHPTAYIEEPIEFDSQYFSIAACENSDFRKALSLKTTEVQFSRAEQIEHVRRKMTFDLNKAQRQLFDNVKRRTTTRHPVQSQSNYRLNLAALTGQARQRFAVPVANNAMRMRQTVLRQQRQQRTSHRRFGNGRFF